MWPFSGVHWDLCLWGGHMASTRCSQSRGTTSPLVAYRPLRPCYLLLGIHPASSPEHHQALSSETSDSIVYRILVVLTPSLFFPISGFGEKSSCSVPYECFHSFSQCLPTFFQGGVFLHDWCTTLSPFLFLSLSSVCKKKLPTFHGFSLPSSPLYTTYLPSSVAQVM